MSLQAAKAYDAALLKQATSGPAVLNFPHVALPPALSNKAMAHVQRPTSAGSGVSSTDVVLDVLASMTPQSASQTSGQAARQVTKGSDNPCCFLVARRHACMWVVQGLHGVPVRFVKGTADDQWGMLSPSRIQSASGVMKFALILRS